MKSPIVPHCGRVVLGSLLAASFASAAPNQGAPRGTLTTDRSAVRIGARVELTWNTIYPSNVHDMVEIKTPGQAVPKKPLNMKIRALGVNFRDGKNPLPVDASLAVNGSAWSRFFYGYGSSVDPDRVLIDMHCQQGDVIEFGARGWNQVWLPFHSTRVADPNVMVLSNGNSIPKYDRESLSALLRPYVDDGGKVRIGSRDLIVIWECSSDAPGSANFDLQDFAILVTFE